MWIRKVVAGAFGPFDGDQLELAPGMNVICGPNEAGKSTWHGALYAALCGMRRGRGRARAEDQEFKDCHFPWHLDRWEVSAEVELSDGRALELYHDLDGRVDSRITDLGTGGDISSEYIFDGAPDGSRLLGLTRDIVLSTIFVRQAHILAVTENAASLQEQLQRAAATSGNDATAEEALALIEVFKKENVGTQVRHSTKPLRSAISEFEKCQSEMESARRQHAEYVRLVQEAQEAETAAGEAAREFGVARALEAREELERLTRRLARAEEIAETLPPERPPERQGMEAEVKELRDSLAAFQGRPHPQPRPEGRSAAAIAEELEALPEPPEEDTEVHESVSEALDRLKDRRSALETTLTDPVAEPPETELEGTTTSELRRLADEIETQVPGVDPDLVEQLRQARTTEAKPRIGATGIAGTAAILVGFGLAIAGLLLIGAAVALVGLVLLVIRAFGRPEPAVPTAELQTRVTYQQEARRHAERRRQKAAERLEELGLPREPEGLRRLARTADSAEADRARYAHWHLRIQRLEVEAECAEGAVKSALQERGVADAADAGVPAEDLVERYRQQCRTHAEAARLAARRKDLEAELQARRGVEAAWEERKRQRQQSESELSAALAAVGLEVVEPSELAQAAETWLGEHQARETRNREAREGWAELNGVLQGETLDGLRAGVDELRNNLPSMPDDWSGDEGSTVPEDLTRLEREAREAARCADELRGRSQDRADNIPDVALAEETFQKAEEELKRVRGLDRVLERTHQFLSEARDQVQRAIAPRLKTAVERYLPSITGGRYTEVLVNADTLKVSVRDGFGQWRDAEHLSHGTKEQIYLLLRVGLVEFIATTGEAAPLVLDDVTVQCDATRTVGVLEMLLALSDGRQIVLFSQEQEVLDWARERLEGERDRLVELNPQTVAA